MAYVNRKDITFDPVWKLRHHLSNDDDSYIVANKINDEFDVNTAHSKPTTTDSVLVSMHNQLQDLEHKKKDSHIEIPDLYTFCIGNVTDVKGDGHCGF